MKTSPLCGIWRHLEVRIRTAKAQGSKALAESRKTEFIQLPIDSSFSRCSTGRAAADWCNSLKGVKGASEGCSTLGNQSWDNHVTSSAVTACHGLTNVCQRKSSTDGRWLSLVLGISPVLLIVQVGLQVLGDYLQKASNPRVNRQAQFCRSHPKPARLCPVSYYHTASPTVQNANAILARLFRSSSWRTHVTNFGVQDSLGKIKTIGWMTQTLFSKSRFISQSMCSLPGPFCIPVSSIV